MEYLELLVTSSNPLMMMMMTNITNNLSYLTDMEFIKLLMTSYNPLMMMMMTNITNNTAYLTDIEYMELLVTSSNPSMMMELIKISLRNHFSQLGHSNSSSSEHKVRDLLLKAILTLIYLSRSCLLSLLDIQAARQYSCMIKHRPLCSSSKLLSPLGVCLIKTQEFNKYYPQATCAQCAYL